MKKQTKKQKKAFARNWSKGIIIGVIKNFNTVKQSEGLSFKEQMKIIKCKKILEEIIKDWKPSL